jgi:hydrogenase maturation protease
VKDVLLLGVGNVLLGDDGLGSWFAHTFAQRYVVPPELEVVEGGTLGLELLDCIAGRRVLVVVDAVVTNGGYAGKVVRLEGAAMRAAFGLKLSTHDIALRDLLAAATLLDDLPSAVVVCGVEPAEIVPQVGLSAPVRAALPALDALVAGELARLGCLCTPRPTGGDVSIGDLASGRARGSGRPWIPR